MWMCFAAEKSDDRERINAGQGRGGIKLLPAGEEGQTPIT
jgi:hypothetical protein